MAAVDGKVTGGRKFVKTTKKFIKLPPFYQSMTQIIINEKVRHGKPIIEGTRITVDEVMGMLEVGMEYQEIEVEYGITRDQILAVIRYAAAFIHGEEVQKAVA